MTPVIRWQDIADIIIMSFIAYNLYGWFRKTKAFQVVVGLGFLGVIYLITKNLGFFMTSWILQELGTVLFVLIIVIFQAEIRQALYRISPLHGLFGRQDQGQHLEPGEFSDAVFSLAGSRTGAIIVIQREEPIDEYLSNGINIDSAITGQIIGSIFFEGSPLHDGALIIRNGRIALASCHLPLSTRTDIPHYFGTRHRAGLGLSERSDAIVVIVSEERGEVTLALSGELRKVESTTQLVELLLSLLAPRAQVPTHISLAKRICGNFWPKLATVGLVTVCWLIVTARQGELVTVNAPIQFRNLPESMIFSKSSQDQVELQLKTVSSLIPLPKEGEVAAQVDLGGIKEGSNLVMVRKEDFNLPSGVQIARIRPAALRVSVERKQRKLLRVEARVSGTPAENLRIKRIRTQPSQVMVEGPESVLSRMENIRTDEIQVSGMERSFTVEKRLDPPAQLRIMNDDHVRVRLVLGK
ncbi:MAG: diadenylate cyclase CdaA [Geobacteraceae bacterium]|nr:diadenylate cyclase CdaA [Geobacteraceae bacterium]